MKSYQANATIQAPPSAVWAILTDAPSYPQWDPGMDRIEGAIAPGEKLKVYTKLQPDRTFPVTVTTFEPDTKMVWSGGMPLGLFKGVRTFTLAPAGENGTEFSVQEVFSGLMLPLIGRSIPDLSDSFQQFAAGLKQRAESGAEPPA